MTTVFIIFSFACAICHAAVGVWPEIVNVQDEPRWFQARYWIYAALHVAIGLKLWGIL